MGIKELLQKLEPILGSRKCKDWWFTYLTEDSNGRKEIEQYLELRAIEAIGRNYDDPILLPPPPQDIAEQGTYYVGKVIYGQKALHNFFLKEHEWFSHIVIVGRSGSGKTNTVLQLIHQLIKHDKPFWIFDFKRNYRDLISKHKDILIYTIGRNVSNILRFNPLIPLSDPHNHIRSIVPLICKAFFLGEGASSLLIKCFNDLYKNLGIYKQHVERYPTFKDVQHWLESYKPKSGARDGQWLLSTLRAIRVLNFGPMGKAINCQEQFPIKQYLNKRIIFELETLTKQDKIFFLGLLLYGRHEYKLHNAKRETFQDVLIIEEAHHLLPRKGVGEEESILEKLLREERELGTSLIIIDQLASRLSDIAFANTATTIALNQKHQADINTVANAVLLNNEEKKNLSKLKVGYAIIRQQERWHKPFLTKIPHFKIEKGKITDEDVSKHMQGRDIETVKHSPKPIENKIELTLDEISLKLLLSVSKNPLYGVIQHYKGLNLSTGRGTQIKKELLNQKLLTQKNIKNKNGMIALLNLTNKGKFYLRLQSQAVSLPAASPEHLYYQNKMASILQKNGHTVQKEVQLKNCRPDLLVDKKIAIEIETGKSKHYLHHIMTHLSEKRSVIVAATNKAAYEKIVSELKRIGFYPHDRIQVIVPKV